MSCPKPDYARIRELEHETGVGLPHEDCAKCVEILIWTAAGYTADGMAPAVTGVFGL